MEFIKEAEKRINQVADLNGDNKVDRADVQIMLNKMHAEAGRFVTKKGALKSCLICFVGGIVICAVAVKLLG
jgi:hypothetical protein